MIKFLINSNINFLFDWAFNLLQLIQIIPCLFIEWISFCPIRDVIRVIGCTSCAAVGASFVTHLERIQLFVCSHSLYSHYSAVVVDFRFRPLQVYRTSPLVRLQFPRKVQTNSSTCCHFWKKSFKVDWISSVKEVVVLQFQRGP